MLCRKKPNTPPSLNISVFDRIIEGEDAATRKRLARQLAELVADRATPPAEREEVTGPLLKLLMDPQRDIRAAIAEILTPVAGLHADIVFAIAADDDDIALPFIRLSPSIIGGRQMAIFEAGDKARRKALAGRCDLEPKTVTAMALKGCRDIILTLLGNASIKISDADLKRIYVRWRKDVKVTEKLLKYPGLPLVIRAAHVRAASRRLREQLAKGGLMAGRDIQATVLRAQEDSLVDILTQARTRAELVEVLAFMSNREMLTPSVILRAGCHGHIRVLEQSLAFLAGVKGKRMARFVKSGRGLPLRAILAKSGLPQSCHLLVRAIFDTARDMAESEEHGRIAPPEAFGRALLEKLASGYDRIAVHDKTRQVELLARFCDDKTRVLAEHFCTGLLQAAA